MKKSKYKFSFVILTWNSDKYIQKCIETFANSFCKQNISAEFIIVDNGSSDKTLKIISKISKEKCFNKNKIKINLKRLSKNMGTTTSRNIGIKEAKGEIIVICDSDTEFDSGNWKEMANLLFKDSKIGLIAPSLYYANGNIQNSVKKFPTVIDKFFKILKIFFMINLKDNDFYNDLPWTEPTVVESAISAIWILRKDIISKVGLLDENIFYSPEDLDYCLRIWKNNLKIIYYPEIKIIHHTQQLSHKSPFSKQSISHLKGLFYYFIKHRYFFSNKDL